MAESQDPGRDSRLSPVSWFLLGGGAAISGMGILLFAWASPSPHGYIELLIAVPIMGAGVGVMALAVLISSRRLPRSARILGWLLLLTSLISLAWIAQFLESAKRGSPTTEEIRATPD
jgi:hypothetical protein